MSWTLAAEGMAPSGRPSVATTTWYLVPALPRSVGLGPVSSPPCLARTEQLSTTTSQDAVSGPARTIRIRATMDPAQQGRGAPVVQATAQGGAASTPGRGPQLAPLHTLTDEEPQRLDDLDRRHGRSSRAERSALDPVDDPRHQRCRLRPHVRLPVPKARETARAQPDAKGPTTTLPGFWKLPLSLNRSAGDIATGIFNQELRSSRSMRILNVFYLARIP